MTEVENIQMTRYYGELEDDMRHLREKYCRIMGWDVPELNEEKARELIQQAMEHALAKVLRGD